MGAGKRKQLTRSKEYNSKIKIFLAGNSCIIEITSCNKLHRKKLPDFIFVTWLIYQCGPFKKCFLVITKVQAQKKIEIKVVRGCIRLR